MRPRRRQPIRLPCPWDSPGKNTGVGSLSLLQGIFPTQGLNPVLTHYYYYISVVSDSVPPQRRQPTRLPRPWDSPGKNTGVGCHFLLQCVKVKSLSRVQLLATPWNAAYQAPQSMGFSRQECWSGVPSPSPKSVLDTYIWNLENCF